MIITLVVAASENNVIGRDGGLPWDLPNDMRHFKEITIGHTVVMGRKTYSSIGRPLPDRRNIIVTRQDDFRVEGCEIVHSLEEAFALSEEAASEEVCVIGGGEIYAQALPFASRIELTRVHITIDGDTFFPKFSEDSWEEINREEHEEDDDHIYPYTFLTYERRE
jgi:dihydrofolate reductase